MVGGFDSAGRREIGTSSLSSDVADFGVIGIAGEGRATTSSSEIDGPFLKPNFLHFALILRVDPLVFSSALAMSGSIACSGGVRGVDGILADDDVSVGLEITIGPRLEGFRSNRALLLKDGVRFSAAVAAAIRAAKSRRTSGSSSSGSGPFCAADDCRLSCSEGGVKMTSTFFSDGVSAGCSGGGGAALRGAVRPAARTSAERLFCFNGVKTDPRIGRLMSVEREAGGLALPSLVSFPEKRHDEGG
jgi:hypothetical protein